MASANRPPILASYLAPLAGSLWIFFLVLSIIVAPIWALDLGEAQLRKIVRGRELQTALLWLSSIVDVAWVIVAFLIAYSSVVKAVRLTTARLWALLILVVSWLAGAMSVWNSWPLGSIYFTGRLGFLVGPVSIGWMLLWCVILLGARDLMLAAFPRVSHKLLAVSTGALAALTDLNLDPLASKTRAWWLWIEKSPQQAFHPAAQSVLAWFILATALTWCLREPVITNRATTRLSKGAQVFLILQLLLLLSHLGGTLRR